MTNYFGNLGEDFISGKKFPSKRLEAGPDRFQPFKLTYLFSDLIPLKLSQVNLI